MSKLFEKMCQSSKRWRESNDCTVKALAIAMQKSYEFAHGQLALRGRNYRKGTQMYHVFATLKDNNFTTKTIYQKYIAEYGEGDMGKKMRKSIWHKAKTIRNLDGVLPKRGVFLVETSSHVLCVRGGEVHDWTKERRHRIVKVSKITKEAKK